MCTLVPVKLFIHDQSRNCGQVTRKCDRVSPGGGGGGGYSNIKKGGDARREF